MTRKYKSIIAIAVFYAVAILLRYLTNKTSILLGVDSVFFKTILQGIGPAVGALIACILFRINMEMGLKGDFKNYLIPLSIYWIFPILLIGIIAYFTNRTVSFIPIITILIYSLFEEIGWRGFLQQLLRPLPKFIGIFIIAALWFIWHLNFELTNSNLLFFGILLLGSWGIGLVADKTKSLLAAAAFHSLNNFFVELNIEKTCILIILLSIWILSIVFRKKLGSDKDC